MAPFSSDVAVLELVLGLWLVLGLEPGGLQRAILLVVAEGEPPTSLTQLTPLPPTSVMEVGGRGVRLINFIHRGSNPAAGLG